MELSLNLSTIELLWQPARDCRILLLGSEQEEDDQETCHRVSAVQLVCEVATQCAAFSRRIRVENFQIHIFKFRIPQARVEFWYNLKIILSKLKCV